MAHGMKDRPIPLEGDLRADTPLRLSVAASIAFPDGSMSASGLRREAARGRLVIERIGGTDYRTVVTCSFEAQAGGARDQSVMAQE